MDMYIRGIVDILDKMLKMENRKTSEKFMYVVNKTKVNGVLMDYCVTKY